MRAVGTRALSEDPSYGGQDAVNHAEYVGTMLNRHYTDYTRDRVPLIESEYTRDEAPRRVWDDFSPPNFDYVHDPGTTYDWTSEQFASTLAASTRYEFWGQRIQGPGNSQYSGSAALTWADSNQHGRQPLTENSRVSGRVDAVRIPKESFYSYRVMQSSTPDIHIIGHWSYPAGTVKSMYVMASHVAKVELFVNGVSKGVSSAPSYDFLYTFPNIIWEPGTIRAVGYDSDNQIVTELNTAGAPASIKLTTRTGPRGLEADGADIAMIDVEVVDAEGRRVPTDQARIDFTVTGPGVFEGGWNSGKLNSVHKSYVDTEAGINRVFVRSTRTPGTITVTATRDGLTLGQTTFTSQPVESNNGLTTIMPAVHPSVLPAAIPAYGPDETPGVNIAADKVVTADSSQASNSPAYAIDGNASTSWAAADDKPGHWWQIDLGSLQPIGGAEIEWFQKGTAYQYKIEVSADGTAWTEVIDKTNNQSIALKQTGYFTAFARYVRITVTGGGLANLREARVFKNQSVSENWNIVNVALKQSVTASSEEGSNRPTRAVDGITTTRWSALTGKAGEWLQVDLGENKTIVGSKVLWYRADRAYQYKIEVSEDNEDWTKVVDATDNLTPEQKVSDTFQAKARYVRITVTGGSWAAISEFEVLGNLIEESEDVIAPVTTAVVDPAVPDGANEWYRKPLKVTLQATDDSAAMPQTQYSLNGGATWETYSNPFELREDGIYQLQYYSKDAADHTEAVQSLKDIFLDQTAPAIEMSIQEGSNYSDDQRETFQYSVIDALSGVEEEITAAVLDGQKLENGAELSLYKLPLGEHVITVTAVDKAGNTSNQSVTFTTTTSIAALKALIKIFQDSGAIDNGGIANSLLSKLNNANLEGFINEVEAQRGKHIAVDAADIILRDARYLPKATGQPGKPVLSDDNGYDSGLKDGNYVITMNQWWGNNGTEYKLYENGVLIDSQSLSDRYPDAQTAAVSITDRNNGTYVYTCELTNSFGTTSCDPYTVIVVDASPGKAVLSSDNWDGDGSYTISMNMWWGTNASTFELYENGELVQSVPLSEASPGAQTAAVTITDKAAGSYEYFGKLINASGETITDTIIVEVS